MAKSVKRYIVVVYKLDLSPNTRTDNFTERKKKNNKEREARIFSGVKKAVRHLFQHKKGRSTILKDFMQRVLEMNLLFVDD